MLRAGMLLVAPVCESVKNYWSEIDVNLVGISPMGNTRSGWKFCDI